MLLSDKTCEALSTAMCSSQCYGMDVTILNVVGWLEVGCQANRERVSGTSARSIPSCYVPSSVDRSSTDEGQEQWGNNYRAAKTARESQFTQAYLCGNAWSGMDGQKEAITSIGTGCCMAYLKSNIISLLCKIVDITIAHSLLLGSCFLHHYLYRSHWQQAK